MVDQLNEDAVGIPEVKRSGSIAMGLGGLSEGNPAGPKAFSPNVHVLDRLHNEADVVELLLGGRRSGRRFKTMEREIVPSGREVNIVVVRFPFDLHAKDRAVKLLRGRDILYAQCNVTQA